jgi:predicted DNA-binding transcriptional regulator AlpA
MSNQIPPLVGVQEAAEILGWDKRKIATYMSRGKFPEPIQRLASGSIWTRQQIEDYRDSRL